MMAMGCVPRIPGNNVSQTTVAVFRGYCGWTTSSTEAVPMEVASACLVGVCHDIGALE